MKVCVPLLSLVITCFVLSACALDDSAFDPAGEPELALRGQGERSPALKAFSAAWRGWALESLTGAMSPETSHRNGVNLRPRLWRRLGVQFSITRRASVVRPAPRQTTSLV